MQITTWNVNSIRARHERVLPWVGEHRPDVLCLQETKVEDAQFPREPYEALGYHVLLAGQRTYNGVAILSRQEPLEVLRASMVAGDPQQRFLGITLSTPAGPLRVVSLYVPNGQAVGTEKFAYKLTWLQGLRAFLDTSADPSGMLALCGDWNVAPEARDVHDPAQWEGSTLYHPAAREAFERVLGFGLVDLFRQQHAEAGLFSWWDYRAGAFHRNLGLRIDHILGTASVAARCQEARIDREARKGKNASDHAPVTVRLEL